MRGTSGAAGDRVRHQLQRRALPVGQRRRGSAFARRRTAISSAVLARAASQDARRGDRVAHRLGLLGRADGPQVQPRERRVALAGEDERQRHRAVQQVRAAVLARPLGRSRDVEHVVEQLEGEPDPAPERAERLGVAAALQRAQRARRLEQPGGLEVAAAQVALARDVRRSTRPRAAAARPRPARRRRRTARAPRSGRPSAASSANARENSRSPVAVAMSRPAAATTVGRPRRSAAPSSTSSCTSVAEWMSSTATAARTTPSGPRAGRLARGEEDEQRPQPLAARADGRARRARPAARRATWRAPPGAPPAAPSAPGTCVPPASTSAMTCSALLIAPSPRGRR